MPCGEAPPVQARDRSCVTDGRSTLLPTESRSAKTLALKDDSVAALDDSRVCTSGVMFPTTEVTMTANIFRFL